MAFIVKYCLMGLFGMLFLWNIICIARKKIDAGIGVIWSLIYLTLIIADTRVDLSHFAQTDPTLLIAISLFLLITLSVAYSHELEIAALRKKNNELGIQLALFRDDFEQHM